MKCISRYAVVLCFVMAGCTETAQSPTGSNPTSGEIQKRILDGTSKCHFVPTIQTIEALIQLFGGPYFPVVDKVIAAVCDTVKESQAAGFRAPSSQDASFGAVRGVPVVGHLTK